MAIFHLPQFEREPFSQYLLRLDDYRAQYVYFMYEKCEIYDVVLQWITHDTRTILESMCYGAMCYLSVDDIWDLFESLPWHQWQYEYASESSVCPFPSPYDLHTQSPCIDQFKDVCDHH